MGCSGQKRKRRLGGSRSIPHWIRPPLAVDHVCHDASLQVCERAIRVYTMPGLHLSQLRVKGVLRLARSWIVSDLDQERSMECLAHHVPLSVMGCLVWSRSTSSSTSVKRRKNASASTGRSASLTSNRHGCLLRLVGAAS